MNKEPFYIQTNCGPVAPTCLFPTFTVWCFTAEEIDGEIQIAPQPVLNCIMRWGIVFVAYGVFCEN